jgi:hypothetical protein
MCRRGRRDACFHNRYNNYPRGRAADVPSRGLRRTARPSSPTVLGDPAASRQDVRQSSPVLPMFGNLRGEPISTAFVKSAVNEIVARRMNKKQQMRWNRTAVQLFLDVRTAVLNETLEDAFRHRYPGFRSANDDQDLSAAARSPLGFCILSCSLIKLNGDALEFMLARVR